MLLCIDIGNTNVLIGFSDNHQDIKAAYRYGTNVNFTADEYYQKIKDSLNEHRPNECIISSVVPSLNKVFIELTKKYLNINPIIVSSKVSPLKINIDNPSELGSDLISDAVGAFNQSKSACVIVDLGTATKIIAVNGKGEILGCSIVPGVKGSLNSLFNSAALLSHTSIEVPEKVIGKNTNNSIQSGITYGTACLVDGMIELTKQEMQEDNIKVYLTGGYGIMIKDILKTNVIYDHDLTLKGMIEIYHHVNK